MTAAPATLILVYVQAAFQTTLLSTDCVFTVEFLTVKCAVA